jgi:hypothetical protein
MISLLNIPWNIWAAIAVAVVTLFSGVIYSGVKMVTANVKLPSLATNPTFAEASQSLSLLARYKATCKDSPEYPMVIAALRQLESN